MITIDTLGVYGTRWLNFMESNHKKLFRELKKSNTIYRGGEVGGQVCTRL